MGCDPIIYHSILPRRTNHKLIKSMLHMVGDMYFSFQLLLAESGLSSGEGLRTKI